MEITVKEIDDLVLLKGPDGLDDIDIEFARFIKRIYPAANEILLLTAALTSHRLRCNHICLQLTEYAGTTFPATGAIHPGKEQHTVRLPGFAEWLKALKTSQHIVTFTEETKPLLVDDKNRIYIQKYYKYEIDLAKNLAQKIKKNDQLHSISSAIDLTKISTYFGNTKGIDYQLVGLMASLVNNLTVITGSPGTGKTSVVATIVAAHLSQASDCKIKLCAPTGKAAARLKDSLVNELTHLTVSPSISETIKKLDASTIHRLLRVKYNTPHFRFNKDNPLDVNLLILDEASMVSLPLMCKLFYALPKSAKIILLGDKDQLASVEEGSVFGDICDALPINQFSSQFTKELQKHTGLTLPSVPDSQNTIVELRKSFRFDDKKGIGLAKTEINSGNWKSMLNIGKDRNNELKTLNLPEKHHFKSKILQFIKNMTITIDDAPVSFKDYLAMDQIADRFKFMESFRILCAKRAGRYGINNINDIIINYLFPHNIRYPNGLPVMITRNDNRLKLYNGDIGIVGKKNKRTRLFFPADNNRFRDFSPNQIPEHEPVFAMTIHKSQGSGFQKILVIMPDKDSPLLTRELFYTAVTRAKTYCEIWSYDSIIKKTTERVTNRDSGLKDKLTQFMQN